MSHHRWSSTLRLLALTLGAVVGLLSTVQAPASTTRPVPPSAQTLLGYVTYLSERIGPRPSGSPAFARAADYVENELRQMGYRLERQPFPFLYFETRRAVLTPVMPAGEPLRPLVLDYSAPTRSGGLEAPLVYAGLGSPDNLGQARAEGKIALVERGETLYREKVAYAERAGALAVIIYNNRPGPAPVGTLISPSQIPAAVISREDGERLRGLLTRGLLRVRLEIDVLMEQRITFNVIGRRAGANPRTLVVGAHLDSVYVSPGANDNASGIAAVLGVAKSLASTSLPLSLEIIGFSGEERALLGSAFYARERGGQTVGMLNLDMVGHGSLAVGSWRLDGPLVELAVRTAGELGLGVTRFRRPDAFSDHVPFEMSGIPTAFLHTGEDPVMHTPGDVVSRVDPRLIAEAVRLAGAVVAAAGKVLR